MSTSNWPDTISDVLRQIVAEAVESGATSYLMLERETGVTRARIRRFVNRERTLRLDMADRLAADFGLELRPAKRKGR